MPDVFSANRTEFSQVADAIRAKGGTTTQMTWPDGFKAAVEAIKVGGDIAPYKSVEVRTWVGDGTSEYDAGFNPGTDPVHIFMAANYNFEFDAVTENAAQLVAIRNESYLSTEFAGATRDIRTWCDDQSKGATFRKGMVKLLPNWRGEATKFQSGITYIVVIGKL